MWDKSPVHIYSIFTLQNRAGWAGFQPGNQKYFLQMLSWGHELQWEDRYRMLSRLQQSMPPPEVSEVSWAQPCHQLTCRFYV